MLGNLIHVPFGRAARRWLETQIADVQRLDPLAPITIVTASWRLAQRLRHTTPPEGVGHVKGRVNVRFVVLDDVVAGLGEERLLASGRRRLTRAALDAATRGALEAAPGGLARVAAHPGTVEELVARYEELREAGEDSASRLARRGGHARDVGRLALDIRRRLQDSWCDDVDLLEAARAELRAGARPVEIGTVLVYLPESLSSGECSFLGELAQSTPVRVALGIVGDDIGDRPVSRLADRLLEVGFVLKGARPSGPDEVLPFPLAARIAVSLDEVVAAADAQDEVRGALRLVVEHLEHGGRPEECALLYTSASRYAPLFNDVLLGSGLAPESGMEVPLSAASAARLLAGLFRLTGESAEVSRDELIAWIGVAPMRDRTGRPVSVGEWDRASRLAGVVEAAPLDFARRMRRTADDLALRADRAAANSMGDPNAVVPETGDSARSERDRRTETSCREIADFLEWLAPGLEEVRTLHDWQGLADWADRWLGALYYLRPAVVDVGLVAVASTGARDRVLAVLSELADLDELDPLPSLERFAAAFDAACAIRRVAPPLRSAGVVVGGLEEGLGSEFALVVVVGAVEGALPGRSPRAALLDPNDRSACGLEPVSSERTAEHARRAFIGALADSDRRIAMHAAWDGRSGRALLRSRFLPSTDTSMIASFARTLAQVRSTAISPVDMTELECAFLSGRAVSPLSSLFEGVEGDSSLFIDGYASVRARRTYAFDRHSGRIGTREPDDADGVRIDSPTGLESYATCPFRYFLSRVVGCEQIDPPERKLVIEARDRGSLVHEILEHFIAGIIDAARQDREQEGTLADATTLAESDTRMLEIAEEIFAKYRRRGLTGRDLLWGFERVRILEWLERERRADLERRRAGSVPVAVELRFGGSSGQPVIRRLAHGSLGFRGMMDRLDRAGNTVEVIDYKTGSARDFEGLVDDCVDRGRHLQLPIYALAARDALEATNSGDGDVESEGLSVNLDYRATFRFVGDSPREIGFTIGDKEIARLDDVLDVLAGAVEAGAFPMRPGDRDFNEFKNCRFCDFVRCCPVDRDRFWEAATASPELSRYVALDPATAEDRAGAGVA